MRIIGVFAALFMGLVALAPSSHAATITLAVNFSATNFLGSATPPIKPVTGSFNLTFDPTQNYLNDTSAVSNFTINLPNFTDTVAFSYFGPFIGGSVGGLTNNSWGVKKNTDDFSIGFTLLAITGFTYSTAGSNHVFAALFPQISIAAVAPATTPIPASLVMLLTALGTLGGAGYLRSRKAQAGAPLAA